MGRADFGGMFASRASVAALQPQPTADRIALIGCGIEGIGMENDVSLFFLLPCPRLIGTLQGHGPPSATCGRRLGLSVYHAINRGNSRPPVFDDGQQRCFANRPSHSVHGIPDDAHCHWFGKRINARSPLPIRSVTVSWPSISSKTQFHLSSSSLTRVPYWAATTSALKEEKWTRTVSNEIPQSPAQVEALLVRSGRKRISTRLSRAAAMRRSMARECPS